MCNCQSCPTPYLADRYFEEMATSSGTMEIKENSVISLQIVRSQGVHWKKKEDKGAWSRQLRFTNSVIEDGFPSGASPTLVMTNGVGQLDVV